MDYILTYQIENQNMVIFITTLENRKGYLKKFGKSVRIKAQMSKSWEILHKYLIKLKKKYNIDDNALPIPSDIQSYN